MATDPSNPTLNVPTQPSEPVAARLRYREAYQRVLADQIAVDPAKLLVINIDVPTVYTTVIGSLERINTLRERASQLKEFDVKNFDNLGSKISSHAAVTSFSSLRKARDYV